MLSSPSVVDPNLAVREAATGLVTPVSMAFLDDNDFLVLEKNTGQVQRVTDGTLQGPVLDLAVNFASERGLLGIALHPDFADNGFVYLYWTESTTGTDTDNLDETPLLGNRVDRFTWDGAALNFDQNIIHLRALQPPNPPHETRGFGNHDGGVIRFGPDGKLYIIIGDTGRRGQMQNLEDGPFGDGSDDDQFGGPEPDNAHLTGVILRLNDDGSTPEDNPFFEAGAAIGGEVGENLQKVFAYGIRNSFGMAFDPVSGDLWTQENGDDSFDELNRVEPGSNSGWIQIMGPADRVDEFRAIETGQIDPRFFGLQQARYSPENIADNREEALSRLFELPGSHYSDPEFSWKFAVAPAGLGFLDSSALGPQYRGDMFVGASRPFLEGGYLFHFNLTGNRRKIAVDDPRLEDRVADNNPTGPPTKGDLTESESLLFGRDFGIGTDIQTGPNGNLYVVSLSNGAVYEIFRVKRGPKSQPRNFLATLSGDEEVPVRETKGRGVAKFQLSKDGTELSYKLIVSNIENVVASHIHLGPAGENGPVVAFLFGPVAPGGGRTNGVLAEGTITADDLVGPLAGMPFSALLDAIKSGNAYVNVHTNDGVGDPNTGPGDFPGGEIRGQIAVLGPAHKDGPEHDKPDGPKPPAHPPVAKSKNFLATLSGDEEVPVRETKGRGVAKFQLSKDGTELSYKLIASNIENVVASHIHLGPAGENGPVVAFLFGPVAPGGGRTNGVLAEGTITADDLVGPLAGMPFSALLDAIKSGNAYVNVHTNDGVGDPNTGPGDFPGGEIRGQIAVLGPGHKGGPKHDKLLAREHVVCIPIADAGHRKTVHPSVSRTKRRRAAASKDHQEPSTMRHLDQAFADIGSLSDDLVRRDQPRGRLSDVSWESLHDRISESLGRGL